MKTSTIIRLALVAMIVIAFSLLYLNISDGETPKKPPKGPEPERTWGPETNGCVMSIKAEKDKVPACEKIILKIYIKNVGETSLPIIDKDIYRDIIFDIRDEKGESVPPTRFGNKMLKSKSTFSRRGGKIESDEEVEDTKLINLIYDMTCLGEYTITAKRSIYKRDEKGNVVKDEKGYVKVEVVSNTITVKVTN